MYASEHINGFLRTLVDDGSTWLDILRSLLVQMEWTRQSEWLNVLSVYLFCYLCPYSQYYLVYSTLLSAGLGSRARSYVNNMT